MAIYIEGNRKIKSIFANVNGEKKSISSAWVNKNGVPTKVFHLDRGTVDPYEVAPTNEYKDWKYVLDNENNIITLQQYINTTAVDVIVYANYVINSKIYKTQLANFAYPGSGGYSNTYMFGGKGNIKSIKFSEYLNTSNVTSMMEMFRNCFSLISLDLSNFDTSNVANMNYMFNNCQSLTDINLSSFNTCNVTSMNEMFYHCQSLIELDLCSFDTNNVKTMNNMFNGASSLKKIYVSNEKWITSNATTTNMFSNCGTSSVTYT